jgi:exodeoxyribonuclease VII small subunit
VTAAKVHFHCLEIDQPASFGVPVRVADGIARRRAATAAFTNFGHGAFLLVAFLALQNGVNCIMAFTKTARRSCQGVFRTLGSGESSVTFTEDMKRLQEIVETLDSEAMPLEESLSLFEEGISLVKRCRLFLNETEQKIQLLSEDADDVVGSAWDLREDGGSVDEG